MSSSKRKTKAESDKKSQVGTENPPKSCLFSEVGKSNGCKLALKRKATKTKYKETEPINPSDVIVIDNDFKPEKNPLAQIKGKSSKKDSKSLDNDKDQNSGCTVPEICSFNGDSTVTKVGPLPDSSSPVRVNGKKDDIGSQVCTIPETQIAIATKTPKANQDDDGLIPDTPQSDKKDEPVKKKIFRRSFLTGSSNLAQNPYVLKKETIDKKQISKARKGLISVSVKFNPSENQNNGEKSDLVSSFDKASLQQDTEICKEKNIPGNIDTDVCDLDNSIQQGIDLDNGIQEGNPLFDVVTPTKLYQGTSIKRMSKCGSSPSPKRSINRLDVNATGDRISELSGDNCTNQSKLLDDEIEMKSGEGTLVEVSSESSPSDQNLMKKSVNRNDNLLLKDKKIHKNMKSSMSSLRKPDSSITYQLSMSRRKKDKKESNVNIDEDNCLGSILGELDTHQQRSDSKAFKPSVISLKKNRRSVTSIPSEKQSRLSSSFNESLTEDDLKYLDDLDQNVHKKSALSFAKSDSSSPPPTESSIQKPSFVTKKVMLAKKRQELSKNKMTDIHNENEEVVPTQTIVEYLSQMGKENMENEDMDIVEFQTQTESQELCDELEMLSPFKTHKSNGNDVQQPPYVNFGRHKVTRVEHRKTEICLYLTDVVTGNERLCTLTGFWADTHVFENDIVNIIGVSDGDTCCISDKDGLIIVNPDVLLSGTTVVSSVFCMRKGVLNEKFKGCDGGNIQMLYGSIIHTVFQQVLQKQLTTEEEILKEAEDTVKQTRYLHDMYKGNTTEGEVLDEIKKYVPQIRKWLEQYTHLVNKSTANSKKEDISITKITDIEENIWSPRFGVKGKIDLTVEVEIKSKGRRDKSIVPLELKTGRPTFSMEHKGQVTLYSMMSSDRRMDPGQGLLLYLREPDMKLVPANHLNKRGLIQLRNEMAYYLSRQVSKSSSEDGQTLYNMGRLPDPINNQRACVKCAQLINCCIYQKSVEQRNLNSSMVNLVPNTTAHLSQNHLDFFVHWCLLLDLETKASTDKGGVNDLWCKTGHEREQDGSCISGLCLSDNITQAGYSVMTFVRHRDLQRLTPVNCIGIAVNDYMIISTERTNHLALCNGTVVHINETSVQVAVESDSVQRLLTLRGEMFRLDKYSSFSTASMLYTNLSKLMMDEPQSAKLRKVLIERQPPEFLGKLSKTEIEKGMADTQFSLLSKSQTSSCKQTNKITKAIVDIDALDYLPLSLVEVKGIFKPLNKPQKTAVLKVIMSKDYVLIKGYPGTGKTATIVSIVQVLNLLGLSVLLTSYTHSAVDNILLKLLKHNIKFVRLGKPSKIHPQIQKYSAEILTKNITSVGDLRQFYSQQKIVATSCLGVGHPVFTQKRFDVCIVDEASQVLLPACLGPLFCADKFVLVGDLKQLPPVVQSKEARELGMDQSLFATLDGGGGTYELNLQYRMNREIMSLSNLLVYDGALQCGSDSVANNQLTLDTSHSSVQWIQQVFQDKPAVFIDTSKLPSTESKNNSGMVVNIGESKIIQQLVTTCIKGGISQNDIGVIAPYRHQVRLIHDRLSENLVEVNTVDQYQGRDKDVIIISFTRSFRDASSDKNKSGELLRDVRRLNVAVSRAKKKLIMVGDTQTLNMYQPLSVLLSMMTKKNLILYPYHVDLFEIHWIENSLEASQQCLDRGYNMVTE